MFQAARLSLQILVTKPRASGEARPPSASCLFLCGTKVIFSGRVSKIPYRKCITVFVGQVFLGRTSENPKGNAYL